jgi:hypothetical protein
MILIFPFSNFLPFYQTFTVRFCYNKTRYYFYPKIFIQKLYFYQHFFMLSFKEIPKELFLDIFQYLSYSQNVKNRETTKRWNCLIKARKTILPLHFYDGKIEFPARKKCVKWEKKTDNGRILSTSYPWFKNCVFDELSITMRSIDNQV